MSAAQWAGTCWLAFCVIVVAGSTLIADGIKPAVRGLLRALERMRQRMWRQS